MTPVVVDIAEKLARITKPWTPGIVAELNGQHVKLVKLLGGSLKQFPQLAAGYHN